LVPYLDHTFNTSLFLAIASKDLPIGFPRLDSMASTFLILGFVPAAILVWGAIGARRALDCFMLTILAAFVAVVTVSASNLVVFYVAWETLCLFVWGLGRWGTNLAGKDGLPANPATALGSLAMFGALAILAYDNKTLEMIGLRAENPKLMVALLLLACGGKMWGLLGPAWRKIEPRAFPVSQGIVASISAAVIGIYPLARFFRTIIEWPSPWQGFVIWSGCVAGIILGLAAIGKLGQVSAANPPQVVAAQAITYAVLSYFGWSVAMTGLIGNDLVAAWMMWMTAGVLGWGAVYQTVGTLVSTSNLATNEVVGRWIWRVVMIIGVVTGLIIAGLSPLVGFQARWFIAYSLLLDENRLAGAAFIVGWALLFAFLGRLFIVASRANMVLSWRSHISIGLAVVLTLGGLVLVSFDPDLLGTASNWLSKLGG
jgi:formate hydrogenlyase subunit 3/multisubunit Na+/H+ antiporter MnhD subunit